MRARDADRRVLVLPNQTPGVREPARLSKAEVDRAAWAITLDGERFEAAAAINRVWQELPRWRLLPPLYRIPPIKWIEDLIYQWIASHRKWFEWWGMMPECKRAGVACVPEGE